MLQMMLKEQLLSNWYLMRWIVLITGLGLGYHYLTSGTGISGLLAIFLLFQAITNTGCLLGYCTPSSNHQTDQISTLEDVTFEEIKTN